MLSALMFAVAAAVLLAPGEFSADTASLSLPIPAKWKFHADVDKPVPRVPVPGKTCTNAIWFDFIPAATVEYTRQLIDTESLEVTAAIRHWHQRRQTDIRLASKPAARLDFPTQPMRTVFLLSAGGGALVVQAMSIGDKPEGCTGAHAEIAEELVALFFAPKVIAKAEELSRTHKPPVLNVVEPTPRTLDECFTSLKKMLSARDLRRLRSGSEADMVKYHHGFGTGLRNSWGLWGGSPLAQYFNAMGIHHPDDMSGIILVSFWRHLKGKPLRVEEQVAGYKRYWAVRSPPQPTTCDDGRPSVRLFQLCNGADLRSARCVHVFACDIQKTYRVWELDKGWYSADQRLEERIAKLRAEHPRGLIEAPIDE